MGRASSGVVRVAAAPRPREERDEQGPPACTCVEREGKENDPDRDNRSKMGSYGEWNRRRFDPFAAAPARSVARLARKRRSTRRRDIASSRSVNWL